MGRNAGFAAAVNRGIRESRRAEWIAVLNSDVELAPDYFEKLAARADALVRHRQNCSLPAIADRIDGTFDAICRGGTAWRVGAGRAGWPDLLRSASPSRRRPWTAALFRAEIFQPRRPAGRALRIVSGRCRFRPALRGARVSPASTNRPRSPGIRAAPRWAAGIPKRSAASRATKSSCWRATIPHRCCARWIWPILTRTSAVGRRGAAPRRRPRLAARRGARPAPVLQRCEKPARRSTQKYWMVSYVRSERIIREFQASTGFDAYWRLYFLLTGGGA